MITIIVLNWNTKELLTPLLDSLKYYTHQLDRKDAEVFIVEQGSIDGSVQVLKDYQKDNPWLRVDYLDKNLGVHGGLNHGLAYTPEENDIVWLSSDCEVLPNWLDGFLLLRRKRPNAGVMTSQLLDKVNQEGQFFLRFAGAAEYMTAPHVTGLLGQNMHLDEPMRQTWVTGACMYITSECRKAIGLFDEEYRIYAGDRDYCYRAAAKGFEIWYCPWSKVYHLEGYSIRRGVDSHVLQMALSDDVKRMNQLWGVEDDRTSFVYTTKKVKIHNEGEKINLPTVTLVIVDCLNMDRALKSVRRSMQEANFGKVKFFTHFDKPESINDIEFVKIDQIKNRAGYSKFCIKDLYKHIDTEHILIIQYDGYVLNKNSWMPEFLDYDYIGPPVNKNSGFGAWASFCSQYGKEIVGNGGFSLRSRRLLEAADELIKREALDHIDEDRAICINWRNALISKGFKFAPVELAKEFAVLLDSPTDEYKGQFGWHGFYPPPE